MKTLKALVVDDDPLCRDMLAEILLEKGYQVSLCPSPGEFFAQHESCQADVRPCVDVLISDNRMPGMCGVDFLTKLKGEFNCLLPVQQMALISGDWHPQDLNRAEELGCQIFSKPTPIDTLFAWLDSLST